MSKTATITCKFECGLQIGQLTSQDVELVKQVTRFGFVDTDRFYSISQAFHSEVLPESELDHLAKLVKDFLYGKLQTSLPRHFASNGKARIADISVRVLNYRDEIFINQRNLRAYMTVHAAVVIEATLDDDSEIDREKLFTLINKRGADDCWYSELDRYLNSTRFCGLEIEYR